MAYHGLPWPSVAFHELLEQALMSLGPLISRDLPRSPASSQALMSLGGEETEVSAMSEKDVRVKLELLRVQARDLP